MQKKKKRNFHNLSTKNKFEQFEFHFPNEIPLSHYMECTLKSTFFIFNAIFVSGIAFRNCILFPFSTNREILLQGKEELVHCALPEVDEEQGWEEALADEGAGGWSAVGGVGGEFVEFPRISPACFSTWYMASTSAHTR